MINLKPDILIIGGGPAGLMAAFVLSKFACSVLLVDAMPSLGRKLLMAGRSGLNITNKKKIYFLNMVILMIGFILFLGISLQKR